MWRRLTATTAVAFSIVAVWIVRVPEVRGEGGESCSAVELEASDGQVNGQAESLQLAIGQRIQSSSEQGIVSVPMSLLQSQGMLTMEVAGTKCEDAKALVSTAILEGFEIEISVGSEALTLDAISVAEARVGSRGDLDLVLAPSSAKKFEAITSANINKTATVSVRDVGVVQRIPIQASIQSGRITLKGDRLPRELLETLRFRIPLEVGECVSGCRGGYAWNQNGERREYRPSLN